MRYATDGMVNHQQRTKEKMLSYIIAFIKQNGFSPTFREIGHDLCIKSISTVNSYVNSLINKGILTHVEASPRTLALVLQAQSIETVQ